MLSAHCISLSLVSDVHSLELDHESLYQLWVKLQNVDPDSLATDMQTLANEQKQVCAGLGVSQNCGRGNVVL